MLLNYQNCSFCMQQSQFGGIIFCTSIIYVSFKIILRNISTWSERFHVPLTKSLDLLWPEYLLPLSRDIMLCLNLTDGHLTISVYVTDSEWNRANFLLDFFRKNKYLSPWPFSRVLRSELGIEKIKKRKSERERAVENKNSLIISRRREWERLKWCQEER